MDLEVAAVDAVVVGDDQLGKLDVLVLDRLEDPVQRLDHQIEPAERRLLQALELLLVVEARLLGHQPTFPVT